MATLSMSEYNELSHAHECVVERLRELAREAYYTEGYTQAAEREVLRLEEEEASILAALTEYESTLKE